MCALAINQASIRFCQRRKSQCQLDITLIQNANILLANEQSNLSREYNARLKGKDISYYANGEYNKMSYSFLMGTGLTTFDLLWNNPKNIKSDNSMILTDAGGLVVMNDEYAHALKKVLGDGCINAKGKGGTFSTDKIPALIAEVAGLDEEAVKEIIAGGTLSSVWEGNAIHKNTQTLNVNSIESEYNNSDTLTDKIASIVDFFYPIFQAAAVNGWTNRYSKEIETNPDYVSDALVSGTLQLQQVQKSDGNYKPDTSLSYFTMAGIGGVTAKQESSHREEVTAWYNQQRELINQKETMNNLRITELDAEMQALNTEMESLKSLIQDDIKIFNMFG